MIQSVVFEDYFRERCLKVSSFSYGIILGGTFDKDECLFLPIEAPTKLDNNSSNVNYAPPKTIQEIECDWVYKHCKNINRMIPGGVRISGMFIAHPHDDNFDNHLVELLNSILNADKCTLNELVNNDHSEKIIMFIDSKSRSLSCKLIDLNKPNDTLKFIDFSVKPILNQWKAIKTSITLWIEATLPSDRKKEKILKRLEAAAEPYLRSLVYNTNMLVSFEKHDDEELLFSDNISKSYQSVSDLYDNITQNTALKPKMKLKTNLVDTTTPEGTEDYWSSLEFNFYGPDWQLGSRFGSASSSESGASSDTGFNGSSSSVHASSYKRAPPADLDDGDSGDDRRVSAEDGERKQQLSLHGTIPGIAFLPVKNTTVGDAKRVFRRDLVRSILARLELLTEELHISSGEIEVPRMYMPQRVLVRLPACKQLPLSDYRFFSETPEDVVARLIYFCLPLGSGDGQKVGTNPVSSRSKQTSLSHSISPTLDDLNDDVDSGHNSISDDPEIAIDTSCLDVRLECASEASCDEDVSDVEFLGDVDQSAKQVIHQSRGSLIIIAASVVILIISVLLTYFVGIV